MNTQKYEHANLPHIIIEYTTHMYLGLCTRRSVEYVQAFTIDAFSDICCKNDMNLQPKLLMKIVFPFYSYINDLSYNCSYPFRYQKLLFYRYERYVQRDNNIFLARPR